MREFTGKYGKNMSYVGHCAQIAKDVWRKWGKWEGYFAQAETHAAQRSLSFRNEAR
jgi:hypothetical protein